MGLMSVAGEKVSLVLPYDLTAYRIDPDTGYVHCRVYWYPRGGEPVVVEDDYLNGGPALLCGVEQLLGDLGIEQTDRLALWVCDTVNAQLVQRPYAVLQCPHGRARLELIEVSP